MKRKRKVFKGFSQDTDTWFDKIAGKKSKGQALQKMCKIARSKPPSKPNFLKFAQLAPKIGDKSIRKGVVSTVRGIKSGKYKREFRYTYSAKRRPVSQVSELFSSFRQACDYYR